jgi:hypothetical protein
MQENLRAINPIGISGIEIKEPPTGRPAFEWVDAQTSQHPRRGGPNPPGLASGAWAGPEERING